MAVGLGQTQELTVAAYTSAAGGSSAVVQSGTGVGRVTHCGVDVVACGSRVGIAEIALRGASSVGLTPEGLPRIGVQKLDEARARIMAAMKANHIFPLHSSSMDNLEQLIKAGIMVTHGTSVELTNKGRAFTRRQMPY